MLTPADVIESCRIMDDDEEYDAAQLCLLLKGLAEYVQDQL